MERARYAVDEVVLEGRTCREVARAHRVSKSWVAKLVGRFREGGYEGIEPRSRAPRRIPHRTPDQLEDEIVALRKELSELGVDAGACTIHYHLSARHDPVPSVSTIWRVLRRRGFVTPEPHKRPKSSWVRFEAQLPNECWQSVRTRSCSSTAHHGAFGAVSIWPKLVRRVGSREEAGSDLRLRTPVAGRRQAMRVLVLVKANGDSEAGVLPDEKILSEMTKFNEELVKAGVMLAGEGLHPSSKGARVRFEDGKSTVIDGPFTESKELVAGFWLWQVRSLDEAIEWLKRAPFEGTEVEIRPVYEFEDFGENLTPELKEKNEQLRNQVAETASR
jgi:transposase